MFRRFVKSFRYLLNPRPPPRSPAETSSSSPTLEPLQPSQETDVPVCESFASLAGLNLSIPEAHVVYIELLYSCSGDEPSALFTRGYFWSAQDKACARTRCGSQVGQSTLRFVLVPPHKANYSGHIWRYLQPAPTLLERGEASSSKFGHKRSRFAVCKHVASERCCTVWQAYCKHVARAARVLQACCKMLRIRSSAAAGQARVYPADQPSSSHGTHGPSQNDCRRRCIP